MTAPFNIQNSILLFFKNIFRKSSALLLALIVMQIKAQQNVHLKFYFGSEKTLPGYTHVKSGTTFNYKTGFGFTEGSEVETSGDYITSKKPFFFAVKVPDGNYDVTLTLGGSSGSSATTVRAECRRLFLLNIRTEKGDIVKKEFTVHVKDSLIRNKKGIAISSVWLKPREYNYLHWDNLLTLEFNDSLPKLCSIEIKSNTKTTTVFLAGNSTVVDQDREPWAAWGQMFPYFFKPENVCIANYAESGETLKAFERENRLAKIWSLAKKGDYLFIEFTHNDQKPGANHLDPFTSYKDTLNSWIKQARKRNITPVLVTSMHRRSFDSAGHIINTLLEYPEAMRQVAKEENVALIDLNAMSKILYESWGAQRSLKAFVHYPPHSFPGQDLELKDNTHFSPYGAYELARCVASALQRSDLDLKNYLNENAGTFDPSQPDPISNWYWPLSPPTETTKPDGY